MSRSEDTPHERGAETLDEVSEQTRKRYGLDNPDNQSGKPNITPWSLVLRRRKVRDKQPRYREPDAAEYEDAERKMKEKRDG